jgi:hypothetical protein
MQIGRTVAQDADTLARDTLGLLPKAVRGPVGGGSLPLLLVVVKARTMAHSLASTSY